MSALSVRVEGVVNMKQVKVFQGERTPKASVQFMGGEVTVKLSPEVFETFPNEGQPVVLYCTGKAEVGEFGLSIKQLKYLKHDAAAAAARPRMAA